MEDIGDQNWDCAHRLFQCVAAASRPLRVKELAEFLAFDFETRSTPTFLADWRPGAHDVYVGVVVGIIDARISLFVSGKPMWAHFFINRCICSYGPI